MFFLKDEVWKSEEYVGTKAIRGIISNYEKYEILRGNCQTFASEIMALFNAHKYSERFVKEANSHTNPGHLIPHLQTSLDMLESNKWMKVNQFFFMCLIHPS